MAISKIFGAISLVGGTQGSLDSIPVSGKDYYFAAGYAARATLYNDGTYSDGVYSYAIVDSGLAENPPYIVVPDEEISGTPYTGTLRWHLINNTIRGKRPIIIRPEELKLGAPSPLEAVIDRFSVLQFSGSGDEETVYTSFNVPSDWENGSNIEVYFYWSPTTSGAGDVLWQFTWKAIGLESNEILSSPSVSASVLDSTQLLKDELLKTNSITISGSILSVDDYVGLSLYRNPNHVSDTYTDLASLVLIKIEYIANKAGGEV